MRHYPDLFLGSAVSSVNPPKLCQLPIAGAIMGDLNAVYAVEAAHRRQLIAAGVLSPETMLLSGSAFHVACSETSKKTISCSFVSASPWRKLLLERMNVCMPRTSFVRELECPCQNRRADIARLMTFGEVNLTVYAVRLVSRSVDV